MNEELIMEKVNEELDSNYTVDDALEIIYDLLEKIGEVRYAYREYRAEVERDKSDDFIPEREIPEIHGKGISY